MIRGPLSIGLEEFREAFLAAKSKVGSIYIFFSMCLEKFFSSILFTPLNPKSPIYFLVIVDDFILFCADPSLVPWADPKKLLKFGWREGYVVWYSLLISMDSECFVYCYKQLIIWKINLIFPVIL